MEALAALSLVCNILQLVGTGLKATEALKRFHDEHKPDASLKSNASILWKLSNNLEQSVSASSAASANASVLSRARDVVNVSRELEQMLQRATDVKKNRVLRTVKYVFKDKDKIEAHEKRLQDAQQALQTTILVDMQ